MIINLPKLGPVQFRDDLSDDEIRQQMNQLAQKYNFKLPKPEVGLGTVLGRGFMRSMGETGIALGDVLPAMGASALGFEDYAKKQMEEAAASREELEKKYPTQFKSFKEISSPYEALQYGAETLGELAPTALTALIPGVGAEAVGARLAGRAAMREALAAGPLSMAGRAAAETAAKEAALAGGKRAMYGGVYLGSLAQNAPEVFQSIYDETKQMEPGIAALAGGISAVLDTIVPGQMLSNLGKYGKLKVAQKIAKDTGAAPSVWKYIGKEAALSAASEGLTETAQEAINAAAEQVAGSTKDFFSPQNFDRFAESFVKGAIGGSAFGVIGGAGEGVAAKQAYREKKAEEDRLKGVRTGSAFDNLSQEETDVGEVVTRTGRAGAGVAGVAGTGAAAGRPAGTKRTTLVPPVTDAGLFAVGKGEQPGAVVDTSKMTDAELAAHEAKLEREAIQAESGVGPEAEPLTIEQRVQGQQQAMTNVADFTDQYHGIRSQMLKLLTTTAPSPAQVDMMQQLSGELSNLVDANAAGLARHSGDPDLIQKLKNPIFDGTYELNKLQAKVGLPHAMQGDATKPKRPTSVKFTGNTGYASNESVSASLRTIEEDDDIALHDESRVGAVMLQGIDRIAEGKKGRATDVLQSITNWADANNKSVVLMPSGNIGGSKEALVSWYERNGFVKQSDGAMVRHPKRGLPHAMQGELSPAQIKYTHASHDLSVAEGKFDIAQAAADEQHRKVAVAEERLAKGYGSQELVANLREQAAWLQSKADEAAQRLNAAQKAFGAAEAERGAPRAMQQENLFGAEEEDRRINEIAEKLEQRRLEREKQKEAAPPTAMGEAAKEADILPEDFAEKPAAPERKGVPPPEKAVAPDVGTEHVAQTDEGRVLAGFFDLINPAASTEQERGKHQSAKNTAADTFLEYDIAEPGAKVSTGARAALNYLASLVGGADKLQQLMGRLEGKSPETQAELFRAYGLPDLTSRRGMESFSHRVQGYFEGITAPAEGGMTIATREGRIPATGEFKGKMPYSEDVVVSTRHVQEFPAHKDGRPRRPDVTAKEKIYSLAVHGLRGAVRAIRQLLNAGGKLSPQQAAAKTYLDSPHRETFGQALNDLAFDLAYFELDSRNHGANSTFFGEGGRHALLFKEWIEQNLDPETINTLNEMVQDYKNNYAAEKKHSDVISDFQAKLKKFDDARRENFRRSRGEKRTSLSEAIPETERGKREKVKTERVVDLKKNLPSEQMLTEIHPAIVRLLEKGDVRGVLKLLAEAKGNSFFSALAERLLESGVTAKSTLIDADTVEPLSGKPETKQTLDLQIKALAEAIRAMLPAEEHAQYLSLLQSNNLRDLEQAVRLLAPVFENAVPAQQEVYRMFSDLYRREFAWDAKYDPATDTIMMRQGIGRLTNQVFLHEVLHAATSHILDNPDALTGVRRQGYNELVKLYNFAKGALSQDGIRTGEIYGLKDLHEFISEALTNPRFQAQLRGLAYKSTQVSLWNRFTQAVAKLFSIKPGRESNVLVEVMRATDAMLPVPEIDETARAAQAAMTPEERQQFAEEQGFYETRRTLSKEDRLAAEAKRRAEMRTPAGAPKAARRGTAAPLPQGLPIQKSDVQRLLTSQTWGQARQELPRLLSSMMATARPHLLGTLTLRQISDLVNNRIPQINNFIRVAESFLARKNAILKEASDIASRWERLQGHNPEMSVRVGKVMHMATISEIDPDTADARQRNAEPELMTEWRALSPEAKQIYRDVRDFYKKRYGEYKRVMMRRIVQMRQLGVSEATITEIRNEFERGAMRGPYFPLMRYGRFWYQIGRGASREYYMFESEGQRDAHIEQRLGRNPELRETIKSGNQYMQQMDMHARESNFLKTAFEAIDDTPMTGLSQASAERRRQELKDNMYQTFLANQPERSFRRQFMHRNNIEGFSQDALRNFASSSFHMAYQLSRFEHSPELFSQLDAARTQLANRVRDTGYDPRVAKENELLSDYVAEVDKRLNMMLNPTDVGTIPSLLSNVGFIYYLTSVASAAVNVLGGAIIGVPTLIGQYVRLHPNASYTTATLEVMRQMKDVIGQIMSTGFAVETGGPAAPGVRGALRKAGEFRLHLPTLDRSTSMSAVDRAAYQRFVADGLIDITQTYDISGLASTPTEQYGGVAHKAMSVLTYLFHNAERFNREVTAMSAFRAAMERRAGMSNRQQAFAESIAEAKDLTNRSMFDYSSTNKPRYFQNPVARIVLQFKQFPQQMTYFLTKSLIDSLKGASPEIRREARARFVGIMGMTAIFAGTTGLWGFSPLAAIVNAVVNGLSDDDEEPFDFELAYMQWATETFGKQLGTLLTRGIGNAMGVDLASRLKLDDMWFRDGRENQDEEEAIKSMLVDMLGPTIGLLPTAAHAAKLWNQGHGDRAIEAIAPGFIKQPLIAYRYAKEGVQTLQGETMVEDVGPFHLFMQSLGIRPADVAELQLYNIRVKGQEQKVLKKRQELLNLYGLAFMASDSDTVDKALDKIDEFNDEHPSVQIPMASLTRSVKERLKKSTQTDHGLYVDKRLRDTLDRYDYAKS